MRVINIQQHVEPVCPSPGSAQAQEATSKAKALCVLKKRAACFMCGIRNSFRNTGSLMQQANADSSKYGRFLFSRNHP